MRACPTDLETDLAASCTTLARLWRITRSDGTVLRFTDGARPIVVSGDTYRSDLAFNCSAIMTSASLASGQSVTLKAPLDSTGISEDDVRAKKYNGALAEILQVNYEAPAHGTMIMFAGNVGQIRISDRGAVEMEITPKGSALSGKTIGSEVYSSTCRASLGDARCGIDIDALKVAFTVTLGGTSTFTADELDQDDEEWTQGFVEWLTGDNAGTKNMVQKSEQSTKLITLVDSPLKAIAIGDTGQVFPGCDKLIETCRDRYANVVNFRGEPNVPGSDILTPVPVTGGAGTGGTTSSGSGSSSGVGVFR